MRGTEQATLDDLHDPICEYCGGFIEVDRQKCPALEDGYCYP